MATKDEIQILTTAINQAKKQGKVTAARNLTKRLNKLQQKVAAEAGLDGVTPMRHLAQGATFGFGDELEAGYRAYAPNFMGGEDRGYTDIRDQIRAENQAERDKYPWQTMGYEMAGALPTGFVGGAKALGTNVARNASPLLRSAGVGAIEGAIYGAGNAEQIPDIPFDALKEGTIGAAINPIMEPALRKGGELMGSVGDWIGHKATASPTREVQNVLSDYNYTSGMNEEDMVTDYMRLTGMNADGTPVNMEDRGTLADVNPQYRIAGQNLLNRPTQAGQEAAQFLNQRDLGQQRRITQASEEALGASAGDMEKAAEVLYNASAEQVAPLYKTFRQSGIELDDVLSGFKLEVDNPNIPDADLQTGALGEAPAIPQETVTEFPPELLKALEKASSNLQTELATKQAEFQRLGFPENYVQRELSELRSPANLLDLTKRQLDQDLKYAIDHGKPEDVRRLQLLKDELVKRLDMASPEYSQARAIHSDMESLRDAGVLGRKIFDGKTYDLMPEIEKLETQGQRDMLKKGVIDAITEKIASGAESHDSVKRLINNPNTRTRLKAAFNNDAKFEQFMTTIADEMEFRKTNDIHKGSQTYGLFKGEQRLDDAAGGTELAAHLGEGTKGLIDNILGMFKNSLSPEGAELLTKVLYDPNLSEETLRMYLSRADIPDQLRKKLSELGAQLGANIGQSGAAITNPVLEQAGLLEER